MSYSQKYCLVNFLGDYDIGYEFDMKNWPLHVTLAGVFAINRLDSEIDRKLGYLASSINSFDIVADKESVLGITPVVLFQEILEITDLHFKLVELLETNGAIFNTPEFLKDGFIPHSTIQASSRIELEKTYSVSSISLVDMYPASNWQKRKVIGNYTLKD